MSRESFTIAADVRLRHGKLFQWLKERNMNNADFARLTGIRPDRVGRYINMKSIPTPKDMAIIEATTGIISEELFPPEYIVSVKKGTMTKHLRQVITKEIPLQMLPGINMATAIGSPEDIVADIEHHNLIDKALDTLCESNPRNAYMFKRYYHDGETFTQLAKDFSLSVGRVEQIIKRVLKKLR